MPRPQSADSIRSLTLCAFKVEKTFASRLLARLHMLQLQQSISHTYRFVLEVVKRLMRYGRVWLAVCLIPPAVYIAVVRPIPLDHIVLYNVGWPVMGHKGSHARPQLARCSTNDLYMQSPILSTLISS